MNKNEEEIGLMPPFVITLVVICIVISFILGFISGGNFAVDLNKRVVNEMIENSASIDNIYMDNSTQKENEIPNI